MADWKLKPHDLITCGRCGKTEYVGNAEGWNTVFDKGVITGHLCPNCQTTEEDIEAQVNEALIDYSKTKTISTLDELIDITEPPLREALELIANGEVRRGNDLMWERVGEFRKAFNSMYRNAPKDKLLKDDQEAYSMLAEIGLLPEQ